LISHERPRALWHVTTLAGVAAVCAVGAWTGRSALAGPRPEDDAARTAAAVDLENQGVSIGRTHEIGLAMTSWLDGATAAVAGTGAGDDGTAAAVAVAADPSVREAGAPAPEGAGELAPDEIDPTTADWSACPPISYDELAALLVGTHVEELPRTDGWGHDLEYCLDREHPGSDRYVVGVRSPGRDGRWQGNLYPVGGFAPDELDGDLLWIDGFFVTWPRPR